MAKTEQTGKQHTVEALIRSILDAQVQCVLATQGPDTLFQHLMAYGASHDLSKIYLASFRETQKVRNIESTPTVSLLWDNRTGKNTDHTDGFALSAQGKAFVLDKNAASLVSPQLRKRNDSLAGLIGKDTAVIIAVDIVSYHLALGYTQTFLYSLRQGS